MKCEFCGAEISEGALACPRCGSPVSKPAGDERPAGGAPAPAAAQRSGQPPGAPVVTPPQPGGPVEPPSVPPPAPGEPFDAPLAPLEEDFISLADEKMAPFEPPPEKEKQAAGPPEARAGAPGAPAPEGAAQQKGEPEYLEADTKLTGGYKGPETASVAGAGVQTEDDPFGLKIAETAPSVAEIQADRHFNFAGLWNVIKMVVVLLVVAAVVTVGVMFLVKGKSPAVAARDTVREFFKYIVSGDSRDAGALTVPGSTLADQVVKLLTPLNSQGVATVKALEFKTLNSSPTNVTLQVTRFDIELTTESNEVIKYKVTDLANQFKLPTEFTVLKQGGKWIVGG